MTDSLEAIKKEQKRNDLLTLQLGIVKADCEKLEVNWFKAEMAHRSTRGWAKMLFIIFLSTIIVLLYMCKQYSDLHALNETQKEIIFKLTNTKPQEHE